MFISFVYKKFRMSFRAKFSIYQSVYHKHSVNLFVNDIVYFGFATNPQNQLFFVSLKKTSFSNDSGTSDKIPIRFENIALFCSFLIILGIQLITNP